MMKEDKLMTVSPVVFVMMGVPGAGKTHTAYQLAELVRGFHIEADEFRQELFETPDRSTNQDQVVDRISILLLEKLMSKRVNVIFDGNSNSRKERNNIHKLAKKHNFKVLVIWVQTDIDTAFMRASSRDRRRVDDKNGVKLDEKQFGRLIRQLESPIQNENYVVVSGKHVFKTQLNSITKKMRDIELLPTLPKQTENVFTPRNTQIGVSPRQTLPRRRTPLIK